MDANKLHVQSTEKQLVNKLDLLLILNAFRNAYVR